MRGPIWLPAGRRDARGVRGRPVAFRRPRRPWRRRAPRPRAEAELAPPRSAPGASGSPCPRRLRPGPTRRRRRSRRRPAPDASRRRAPPPPRTARDSPPSRRCWPRRPARRTSSALKAQAERRIEGTEKLVQRIDRAPPAARAAGELPDHPELPREGARGALDARRAARLHAGRQGLPPGRRDGEGAALTGACKPYRPPVSLTGSRFRGRPGGAFQAPALVRLRGPRVRTGWHGGCRVLPGLLTHSPEGDTIMRSVFLGFTLALGALLPRPARSIRRRGRRRPRWPERSSRGPARPRSVAPGTRSSTTRSSATRSATSSARDWTPAADGRGKIAKGAAAYFGRTEAPRGVRVGDANYVAVDGCVPATCRSERVLLLIQEGGEGLLARLDEGGFSHYYAYGGTGGSPARRRRSWTARSGHSPARETRTRGPEGDPTLDRLPLDRYAEACLPGPVVLAGCVCHVDTERASGVRGAGDAPQSGARRVSDLARLLAWAEECLAGPGSILLMTDYDGTLTPIVDDPADAVLAAQTREDLARLARSPRARVAVISGRGLEDLRARVGAGRRHLRGLPRARDRGAEPASSAIPTRWPSRPCWGRWGTSWSAAPPR